MKKKNLLFIVLIIILISFSSCYLVDHLEIPPKPFNSILMVLRDDGIGIGKNDIVKVYMNGQEITELKADGYKALHIVPGDYDMLFLVFDETGAEEYSLEFTGTIEPETVYRSAIGFKLGWMGFGKFFKDDAVFSYAIFEGEIDLTETLSPK